MKYILKTMAKDSYEISQETRDKLLQASGLCLLTEIDTVINTATITSITPLPGERAAEFFRNVKFTKTLDYPSDNLKLCKKNK